MNWGFSMRTPTIAMRAVLACSALAAGLSGCSESSPAPADRSAEELLDDANRTMSALSSVAMDTTGASAGGSHTSHMTTDRKSKCRNRTTWADGGTLEQIRIDDTDYVRPDAAHLKKAGHSVAKAQTRWAKTPAGSAEPGDGLASCPYPFTSFGEATKGNRVAVGGRQAIEVVVHDRADRDGQYTFTVAAEGKPYILKVLYKSTDRETTTSFSGFDEPLTIRPPAAADVVDGAVTPQ